MSSQTSSAWVGWAFLGGLGLVIAVLIAAPFLAMAADYNPSAYVPPAEKAEWYEGGTLHAATIISWRTASDENKLATAADWTAAAVGDTRVKSMHHLQRDANEVVLCVDKVLEASGGGPWKASDNVSSIAMGCIRLMGLG